MPTKRLPEAEALGRIGIALVREALEAAAEVCEARADADRLRANQLRKLGRPREAWNHNERAASAFACAEAIREQARGLQTERAGE